MSLNLGREKTVIWMYDFGLWAKYWPILYSSSQHFLRDKCGAQTNNNLGLV